MNVVARLPYFNQRRMQNKIFEKELLLPYSIQLDANIALLCFHVAE